jgi:hypothetical protein
LRVSSHAIVFWEEEPTAAQYPFENAKQRALVSVDIQTSYSLAANEDLCRMVLINLVRNALHAITRQRRGAAYQGRQGTWGWQLPDY